jgi:hypothetical protein
MPEGGLQKLGDGRYPARFLLGATGFHLSVRGDFEGNCGPGHFVRRDNFLLRVVLQHLKPPQDRGGGRVVECGGLENR